MDKNVKGNKITLTVSVGYSASLAYENQKEPPFRINIAIFVHNYRMT